MTEEEIVKIKSFLETGDVSQKMVDALKNLTRDIIRSNDELCYLVLKLINDKANEAVGLYNAIIESRNPIYPSIYKNVLVYSNLPFRYSKERYIERYIIYQYYGMSVDCSSDLVDYMNLIEVLLNYKGINMDYIRDDLKYYLTKEQVITFYNLDKATYCGHLSKDPFIPNINVARESFVASDKNAFLSNYGEGIALEYLKSIAEDGDNVYWVSYLLGDGYGYDILVYNLFTNKYIAYEVKTNRDDFYYKFDDLTFTEMKTFYGSIMETPNYEYKVINVAIDRVTGDFLGMRIWERENGINLCFEEIDKRKVLNAISGITKRLS